MVSSKRTGTISVAEILDQDPERMSWVEVPVNPVVEETKNLAGAESIAGLANIAGTMLVALVTTNPLLLALSGPVLEKIGFPLWELLKALFTRMRDPTVRVRDLYRQGIRGTLTTLREDVLWHDPAYIVFIWCLLTFTNVHPGLAAAIAFLAAIPVAAGLESLAQECGHWLLKRVTRMRGFAWESYFETRFLLTDAREAQRIFAAVRSRFGLQHHNRSAYADTYYRHRLPTFGRRLGLLRYRDVTGITGPYGSFRNLELSYTLVMKETAPASEHNLFYLKKEKGRHTVKDRKRLPFGASIRKRVAHDIAFERTIVHDEEIRLALDKVAWRGARHFWILELKAYRESPEFFDAMRYILRHSSAMTCTYSKSQLVERFRQRS